MRFSVCIDQIFPQLPPVEAMERVHALGFSAVEFWGWGGKELDAMVETKEKTGLAIAAFCTSFFQLTTPSKRQEYIEGLCASIEKAKQCGCKILITQPGDDTGAPREEQLASMAEGLRACAPYLERAGVTLAVEPLNRIDHPRCFLSSSREAFWLTREVASPRVKILFDLYHQQMTEGNLIPTIEANIGQIAHFHAAGCPGRHEPQTSALDYRALLGAIEHTGYEGYVGLEYVPALPVDESLKGFLQDMAFMRG